MKLKLYILNYLSKTRISPDRYENCSSYDLQEIEEKFQELKDSDTCNIIEILEVEQIAEMTIVNTIKEYRNFEH